jgi:hypothetical protein
MSRPSLSALAFSLVILSVAPRARADGTSAAAAADALYEASDKLAKEGKWAEAKAKLEASLALDPGTGTLIRIAYCEEKLGRLASAWTRYNEAEAQAAKSGDKRAKVATDNAKRLEPLLAKLSMKVAPQLLAGGEIKLDGNPVKAGAWDVPIPLDAGEHTVEVTQAGKKPRKTPVTIPSKPGVTVVEVPALEDAPQEALGPVNAPVATPAPAAAPFWGSQRIAGVVVGSVGLAGLVAGGVLGGLAISKNNASKASCLPAQPNLCHADGVSLRQTAGTFADASTGTLVVGGAALVAGVVVFAVAPSPVASAKSGSVRRVEVAPVVGGGVAGLRLGGAW